MVESVKVYKRIASDVPETRGRRGCFWGRSEEASRRRYHWGLRLSPWGTRASSECVGGGSVAGYIRDALFTDIGDTVGD